MRATAATVRVWMAGLAVGWSGAAQAQIRVVEDEPIHITISDPTSAESRAEAELNRKRVALERELTRLRATYFRGTRNVEKRQIGLSKLREHTDPAAYESLVKIFGREGDDVHSALASMFADQASPEGDAALAWASIMVPDEGFRRIASAHLRARVSENGGPTPPMVAVLDTALQGASESRANAAAAFADEFEVIGLIPRLISAQVTGRGGGSGGGGESDRSGDLAFIAIGRQVAFVADLTPVVSDSAVAFDPTIGVINEGTLVRIHDATVTIYREEINRSLTSLSSRAWGRSTRSLGFDTEAWKRWYIQEFLPAQREAELAKAAAPDGTANGMDTPRPSPAPPPPSGG